MEPEGIGEYVRANVGRANADPNTDVTQAESNSDLKDSLEARSTQGNSAVTASRFVTRFTENK